MTLNNVVPPNKKSNGTNGDPASLLVKFYFRCKQIFFFLQVGKIFFYVLSRQLEWK